MRRNPWITGAAALPFAAALAALVAGVLGNPAVAVMAAHLTIVGAVTSAYAWMRNWRPRRESVEVAVDGDSLVVGRRRIPRARIKAGFVVSHGARATVKIVRHGMLPIELEVDDEKAGNELLRELGLDVSQAVASFRAMSILFRHKAWMFGAAAVLVGSPIVLGVLLGRRLGDLGFAPMLAGIVAYAASMLWPTTVEVGADGVLVRWLSHRRFIRHEHIASVGYMQIGTGRQRRYHVKLVLKGGDVLDIPVADATFGRDKVQMLTARIEQALDAQRAGEDAAESALLARRGREHRDWVSSLRGLVERASHRTAAVPAATLWRIVEDSSGEPVARAAAAVALQPHLGAADRERLGRAARATAAPQLRIALEAAAAGGDDDAMAEALADVEQEEVEAS
jgi:hypothetical protein